jgi:hypothetical protein
VNKDNSRNNIIINVIHSSNSNNTYLRCVMYIMGTPGILRMRRLRSRSHVATM